MTVEPTLELSSEIYETLTGMTTDVYPRENCIAPAMVFIVWTTDTTNGRGLAPDTASPYSGYPPSEERGVAHRGDAGEVGVGRDGRVIDLRVFPELSSLGEKHVWSRAERHMPLKCVGRCTTHKAGTRRLLRGSHGWWQCRR